MRDVRSVKPGEDIDELLVGKSLHVPNHSRGDGGLDANTYSRSKVRVTCREGGAEGPRYVS